MKNLIFLFTVLFTVLSVNSQQIDQNQKDYLMQRSNKQKTAAWILVGAGTAAAIVGAIGFEDSWDDTSNSTTDIYGGLLIAGVVADLVSIPFFISSGANKRKAASISVSYENYSLQQYGLNNLFATPSIGLKIQF